MKRGCSASGNELDRGSPSRKSKDHSSPEVLSSYLSGNGAESEAVLREAWSRSPLHRTCFLHAHGAILRGFGCTRISHVTLLAAVYFRALSRWPLQLGY
jgi:hypothetical protein